MINNLPQIHPLKSQRISEQILVLMYKLAPTQKEECQIPKKLQRKSLQLNKSGVVCSRGSWIPILSPPPQVQIIGVNQCSQSELLHEYWKTPV